MSKQENVNIDDKYTPRWALRAEYIPSKPRWVDKIPHELWELGEVFFPIPRRRKGWNWPHHIKRYTADDQILNAYLESGAGYGIACAGDLAVVDIDEIEYADYIMNKLPDTLHQITGSRSGYHLFYLCENLDNRINLRVPYPENHMMAEGYTNDVSTPHNRHFGEVKCDEHGYVVGPGSIHPSGNKYGPLEGDKIVRVSKEQIEEALKKFTIETSRKVRRTNVKEIQKQSSNSKYDFFNLDADDVVSWLEPEKRIEHPGHGSDTGINFMKNQNRKTFTCWRHNYGGSEGCALTPLQLLAQIESGRECDRIRDDWPEYDQTNETWRGDLRLYWYAWKRAVRKGLVSYREIPYRVIKGFALDEDWVEKDEEVSGQMYWDAINTIRILMEKPHLPGKEKMEDE